MKKLVLLLMLASAVMLCTSCVKSCVCVNPDTDVVTDLNIDPTESCSNYSSSDRGTCS